MGICASAPSSIYDYEDTYGPENAVHYTDVSCDQSSRAGYTCSQTGSKGLNQDSSILFQGYGVEGGIFCGVFDGHGKNGHIVSKLVRNRLPSLLLDQTNMIANTKSGVSSPNYSFFKWKEACLNAFKVMDEEIKLIRTLDSSCSGSTAAIVVKLGNDLLIANIGDSRAVLGTMNESGIKSRRLTIDSKPGTPCESMRIKKCNGRVLAFKESHIQRVCLPYDNSPALAMSRAFGDFLLKKHGVISTPDVSDYRLSPNDQFLVMASDGVWDMLSDDQVIDIVSSFHDEESAAKAVVEAAVTAWREKFPNSKIDDCTVVCLFLQKKTDNVLACTYM